MTTCNNQFAVFDDVFDNEQFQRVNHYVKVENYTWIQHSTWNKVWRLTDGNALWGPQVCSDAELNMSDRHYPTGADIDLVTKLVFELAEQFEPVMGKYLQTWTGFALRAYIYPQNTGLSWHVDEDTRYPGAFIFYAHESWNVQWGGELMIGDVASRMTFPDISQLPTEQRTALMNMQKAQQSDNAYLNGKLLEEGVGTYILPKPNRLVVLGSGVVHGLKKVEPAAGDHVRQSIAGFFIAPE